MIFQPLREDACDCHVHFFDSDYPVIPGASLNPPPASVSDYEVAQESLGCKRLVIVQPSIYGLDNSLLLKTLRAIGTHRALGVAVVNAEIADAELSDLYLSGVRGVRFNQVQNGVTTMDMLVQLDGRLNERNMHIQFHAPPKLLIESESLLTSLRAPVVIDHIGRMASAPELTPQVEKILFRLMNTGRVWLKLSGPYLASRTGAPYADISPFISKLMEHFPERLVWGSDWPHATEDKKQDDRAMAEFFRQLMPSPEVEYRVFTRNAELLYGFLKCDQQTHSSS